MRTWALIAAAAAACLPAIASAADLPLRSAPPPFLAPPPIFTWTGFYIGGNAGYDFDHKSRFVDTNGTVLPVNSGIGTTRPVNVRETDDGFTGGGQIGYNYQIGGFGGGASGFGAASLVLGFEADAAYTDINKTVTVAGLTAGGATTLNTFRSQLDYLGTVRGRLGLAFDRFMVYGTGGFAYGEVENRVNFFNAAGGSLRFGGGRDRIETGYAVGGGIEYAMPTDTFLNVFHSSAVTIKAEYLYYDLGSRSFLMPATPGGGGLAGVSYATRVSTEGNIVRAGINYKF